MRERLQHWSDFLGRRHYHSFEKETKVRWFCRLLQRQVEKSYGCKLLRVLKPEYIDEYAVACEKQIIFHAIYYKKYVK